MITMPHITPGVIGWDIGGVNTKAVLVPSFACRSIPFEIQHDPAALESTLRRLADDLGADGRVHAITMTAELSQTFRTKREGVGVILDAAERAFPGADLRVYTVGGRFVTPAEARSVPLEVAASNWAATARLVARFIPDCIVVDIGTTSTDIIPIVRGEVVASGRTDPERLASGELVYTGALRTPCEAVASEVPLGGAPCAVSAEGFALMGDVHLWCGRLAVEDYTVRAPDGRPATQAFAGERLARVVCADREMLTEAAISEIAGALAAAQVRRVSASISRVRSLHPQLQLAVVTGLGDFIAADAARAAGVETTYLADRLGSAARTAPAAAVAWLLAESLSERRG
jgi:(4-(4-[2-(gamma-L-glutamylamino)ethyl]phenoxymethyl)furan-2-yl)methanamine synthase